MTYLAMRMRNLKCEAGVQDVFPWQAQWDDLLPQDDLMTGGALAIPDDDEGEAHMIDRLRLDEPEELFERQQE